MSSIISESRSEAALVFADGTLFKGISCGAAGSVTGEVVFNTSVCGYQEVITDPSYRDQIVMFTYPHIGNAGVNTQDAESDTIQAAALIISSPSPIASNFRSEDTLDYYARRAGKIILADIDTRAVTRRLREEGTQPATIVAAAGRALTEEEIAAAQKAAQDWTPAALDAQVQAVTTKAAYEWRQGQWELNAEKGSPAFKAAGEAQYKVVSVDFGVTRTLLRQLTDFGMAVTVVPADTTPEALMAMAPDGVFLSTGPGNPAACTAGIELARACLEAQIPLFGVGLGHQILALALGAQTQKLKVGFHGVNLPVKDLEANVVHITSQHQDFAIVTETLPQRARVTHTSLIDQTVHGLCVTDAPALSFQGYPSTNAGPNSLAVLFERFAQMMQARKNAAQ